MRRHPQLESHFPIADSPYRPGICPGYGMSESGWQEMTKKLVDGAENNQCGRANVSISNHQTHAGKPSAVFLFKAGHFYRFYSIDIGGRIALAENHACESDTARRSCSGTTFFRRETIAIESGL